MEKLFEVKSRSSGEVFGLYTQDEESTARRRAERIGPDAQIVTYKRAADGPHWVEDPASPENKIETSDAGLVGEAVLIERTRILAYLDDCGIGGLVRSAVAEGLTPEQAHQSFLGKSDVELFGPLANGGLVKQLMASGLNAEQARLLILGKAVSSSRPGPDLAANQEAAFLAEWDNPAVQAEFMGRKNAFLAYKGAEAQGLVCVAGRNRTLH